MILATCFDSYTSIHYSNGVTLSGFKCGQTVSLWRRLDTGGVRRPSTAWWSHFRHDQHVLFWVSPSTPLHICAPSTHVVVMSWLLELYCHHLAHQPISAGLVGRKNTSNKPWPPMASTRVWCIRIQLHSTSKDTQDPLAMLSNEWGVLEVVRLILIPLGGTISFQLTKRTHNVVYSHMSVPSHIYGIPYIGICVLCMVSPCTHPACCSHVVHFSTEKHCVPLCSFPLHC